jgi:endogenous inhibitor of DNA gyrase (YacG/DUF329 family)
MPKTVKCPTCHSETAWEDNPHRPFCSKRCQLIDLGAWASEKYRLPSEDLEIDDSDDGDDNENNPLH